MPSTSRIAACILSSALAGSCAPSDDVEPAVADNAVSVTTATARIETLRDDLVLTGRVVPSVAADHTVYAPEAGLIVELPSIVGDTVSAGDLLVRFDIPSITAQVTEKQGLLDLATQRVNAAQAEFNRTQELYDRGLVARNAFEAQRAAVADAESAVSRAQAEVNMVSVLRDSARLTAPFDGLIREAWKVPGDFVDGTRADPVLRLVDPTRTQIAIDVPVEQVGRLTIGQVATMATAAGEPVAGSIRRVTAVSDPAATTAEVRLGYESPTPLDLDAELRVELLLDERTDAIVVPAEAVLRDAGGPFVMLAGDDLLAHRRSVRVGLESAGLVQVIQGLSAGDRIIVGGVTDLPDGAAIRVSR